VRQDRNIIYSNEELYDVHHFESYPIGLLRNLIGESVSYLLIENA